MTRAGIPEVRSPVKSGGTTNVADGADMETVKMLQLFDPRMIDKRENPNVLDPFACGVQILADRRLVTGADRDRSHQCLSQPISAGIMTRIWRLTQRIS